MPNNPDTSKDGNDFSKADLRAIVCAFRDGGSHTLFSPYLARARIIAQTIHPFMNLHCAFYAGVPEAALELGDNDKEDGSQDEKEEGYSEEERYVFGMIMKLEQGFPVIVDACALDTKSFIGLINCVSEASAASQSDDTAKLQGLILDLLYEDVKSGSRFASNYDIDHLSTSNSKDVHGFLHIDTADLLCPLRFKNKFEEDLVKFTSEVLNRTISITDEEFSSFMYESGTEYDPEDFKRGLFHGFLLVQVFHHIFMGPSSAINSNHVANKTKAKVFRLTKVTGHMIAYTAVQTYLTLLSVRKWTLFIDLFELNSFYNNIISMFKDNANSPFIKDTLEWWQAQIPGLCPFKKKRKECQNHPDRSHAGLGPAEQLRVQLKEEQKWEEEEKAHQCLIEENEHWCIKEEKEHEHLKEKEH